MYYKFDSSHCPNVSTTPITAMGGPQYLPLSVVQLKGKHYQKPHCCNGVVDTFGHWELELVNESQLGEVQMKPPMTAQAKEISVYAVQDCKRIHMSIYLKAR